MIYHRHAGTASDYAYEPLCWAIGTGVLQGTAEGLLNPSGTATRAQAAVIFSRFCRLMGA